MGNGFICFQEKIIHSCRFVTALISYCTSKQNVKKDEKIQNSISSSSSSNGLVTKLYPTLCNSMDCRHQAPVSLQGDGLGFAQIHMNH